MRRESTELDEGLGRRPKRLVALVAMLGLIFFSDLFAHNVHAAETKPVFVEELIRAAKQQGIQIIVIDPEQRTEPAALPPPSIGGGALGTSPVKSPSSCEHLRRPSQPPAGPSHPVIR